MSRGGTLILLGVLILLIPFSGLPVVARTTLITLLGLGVCGVGLSLRAHETKRPPAEEPASVTQ